MTCGDAAAKGWYVPGEGPQPADVMIVGQNPGKEEVKQRRPFVGPSGKYLNRVLEQHNIDRSRTYVTNVFKEPTKGNRKPTREEMECWRPYLEGEIKRVKPKVIILLGEAAWHTPRVDGITYFETYHPSAAMRFARARERFLKDFEKIEALLKEMGIEAGLSS